MMAMAGDAECTKDVGDSKADKANRAGKGHGCTRQQHAGEDAGQCQRSRQTKARGNLIAQSKQIKRPGDGH